MVRGKAGNRRRLAKSCGVVGKRRNVREVATMMFGGGGYRYGGLDRGVEGGIGRERG